MATPQGRGVQIPKDGEDERVGMKLTLWASDSASFALLLSFMIIVACGDLEDQAKKGTRGHK